MAGSDSSDVAKQRELRREGTKRMVDRLALAAREAETQNSSFLSNFRADKLRRDIASTKELVPTLDLRLKLAGELLRAGQSELALREYEDTDASGKQAGIVLPAQFRATFEIQRALCYMRIGEQENCQFHHTTESCLFPIRGAGIHQLPRGSRGAAQVLTPLLEADPGNLRARWLLNVACMTLGEYPDKVPPRWLMPPKLFESVYDIKKFPDIAGGLGIDVDGLAGGVIAEDFDNDGFIDIAVSSWGFRDQLRLFHNNGDGTFTERTLEAGLTGIVGGLNMMQTDYNNDGLPDIFILRGGWFDNAGHLPNSLLRNNGDGTFDDVTEEAGLLSYHPTQTATWLDFDGDGWLDVFIGNESRPGDAHPCELYRNNGNGTFTECAAKFGVAVTAYVKGVTSADFDNDGRPDLYLSLRPGANVLFHNDGPVKPGGSVADGWKFTDVAAKAGVTQPEASFSTWFFDYDNDGWADLFVAGYFIHDVGDIAADYLGLPHDAQFPCLYHNNRDGTFTDVTEQAGLKRILYAMGCNFGDLDNDGWLDFYIGTGDPDLATLIPNLMFRNDGGRRFQDVTTSGGFGHLQKGHGIAFADFDNDGDQDIYEVLGGAYPGDNYRNALFHNPGHGNHWLKLKLEGVKSNRAAIGARIRVDVETGQGIRAIYKTVSSGGSFGASPLRQEIGLGDAKRIKYVEIFWPATKQTQVVQDLEPDHAYRIREGDPRPANIPLKVLKFDAPAMHHHVHTLPEP